MVLRMYSAMYSAGAPVLYDASRRYVVAAWKAVNTNATMAKKVAIFPMVFQFFKVIPAFEWVRMLFKLCPNSLQVCL